MKFNSVITAFAAAFLLAACSTKPSESADSYEAMLQYLNDDAAVAYVDCGDQHLMLVSQETYGEDTTTNLNAISASVFAKDSIGKIICLGSIRSQGTLYPVSESHGLLMTAGHHFVNEYKVEGNPADLSLEYTDETDTLKLKTKFDQFEKATPLKFNKIKVVK